MTERADRLESALLQKAGFEHGFFTRHGGVSSGAYASLNFSSSVGDAPERVAENLRRAARELGVAAERVYFLSQVHGTRTLCIRGDEPRDSVITQEGDALVSRAPGVAVGVRSADCVPVLIADPESGAVAAAHAGWRGAARGVVSAALGALTGIGGAPSGFIAAIGPHISLRAFEVSEDVAETLARASHAPNVVDRSFPKPHVDLRAMIHAELLAAGLGRSAIDDVWGCTQLEPERFFSFRRDGPHSGRHLSAIVPAAR